METEARLLFLGTGGSMGIPVIGCSCAVCRSSEPRNHRLRPSALIQWAGKNILIDAGPDLRTQALKYKIEHLEGVIFTHAHHDHVAGIDDLRVFYMWSGAPIPCLLSHYTAADLKKRYSYIFQKHEGPKKLLPKVILQEFADERGEVSFEGLDYKYFTYEQGGMPVNGFRVGNLAYVSDIRHYPDTIFADCSGVEVLVLSALRHESSPLHFSIREAVAFSEKVLAKQTWLTHIAHEVDHPITDKELPPTVRLAYDGLSIPFKTGKR